VINVDPDNQRLSLSIKEFMPSEWDEFAKGKQVDDEVTGTVSKITDFGLFIELGEGVEGLAHVSEIPRDPKVKLDRIFRSGDEVRARIIKIDFNEKKLGLTLKDVEQPVREGREEMPEPDSDTEPETDVTETPDASAAAETSTPEALEAVTETETEAETDSDPDAAPGDTEETKTEV
jgi:small subunit ribosomal protein S1